MNSKAKENIESIVVAIVLAFIIRASVVEAFVVPTGSMAPAIYGRHVETTCGTCGFELVLGMRQDEGRGDRRSFLECPVCGESTEIGLHSYSSGDRLLVNKFVHKMKGLTRWEIIVFKCPDPEKKKEYVSKGLSSLGQDKNKGNSAVAKTGNSGKSKESSNSESSNNGNAYGKDKSNGNN